MKDHFLRRITRRDFLKYTAELCFKLGLSSIFLYSCKPDASRNITATPVKEASITKTPTPVKESSITRTPTPVEKPSITKTPTLVRQSGSSGSDFEPAYVKLHKTGELKKRAEELWAIMEECQLCPRRCGVNRLEGKSGF
jgi:hypothetical protein